MTAPTITDNGLEERIRRIMERHNTGADTSMRTVKFHILGMTPILMNNPASMGKSKAGMGVKMIPAPEEEAEPKLYKMPDGQLYVLSVSFRAAIVHAGTGQRIAKRAATSVLSSSVFVVSEECPLFDADTLKPIKTYEIDTRRAVVQNQGVMRSRPKIDNWCCELVLEYDSSFVTEEILLQALQTAGRISGVGDFRPQKKGPFGRFMAWNANGQTLKESLSIR